MLIDLEMRKRMLTVEKIMSTDDAFPLCHSISSDISNKNCIKLHNKKSNDFKEVVLTIHDIVQLNPSIYV